MRSNQPLPLDSLEEYAKALAAPYLSPDFSWAHSQFVQQRSYVTARMRLLNGLEFGEGRNRHPLETRTHEGQYLKHVRHVKELPTVDGDAYEAIVREFLGWDGRQDNLEEKRAYIHMLWRQEIKRH